MPDPPFHPEGVRTTYWYRRRPSILVLYVRRPPPGATRAPINLIVYASWRTLSGHSARETIYYKM
eukprot:963848-Pyramimonas_sp.AAC.1